MKEKKLSYLLRIIVIFTQKLIRDPEKPVPDPDPRVETAPDPEHCEILQLLKWKLILRFKPQMHKKASPEEKIPFV